MVWILGPSPHPLRIILKSHVHELSRLKWGFPDLTWLFTKGGSSSSCGSSVWNTICKAWSKLKPLLCPTPPRNVDEWRLLPLWSPHHNHIDHSKVRCSSQAQHRIREEGICLMGDILSPTGQLLTWAELHHGAIDRGGERAFASLTANLHQNPILDDSPGNQPIFFESTDIAETKCIWHLMSNAHTLQLVGKMLGTDFPLCNFLFCGRNFEGGQEN